MIYKHVQIYTYDFHCLKDHITPGPVTKIQSKATFSSIKVSWSAPTHATGKEICVDYYYVQYSFGNSFGLDYEMAEAVDLEFELTQLKPFTFVSFKVRAECQGRLGPEVLIGHSTGNIAAREYYMHPFVRV